jgi:ribosomal protein L11 methyltransferase
MLTFQLHGSLDSLDALTPALWDAGCQGLEERGERLIAYFAERVALPFDGEWLEADDTDWLEAYRRSVKPVRIGRVIITPSWDLDFIESPDILIDLEPGMAFGTGQHETTRLAIEALQRLSLTGKHVLDVGAGTGILGMVAERLGAHAMGLDNDPSTVPVANDNARRNGSRATFYPGTLEDLLAGKINSNGEAQTSFEIVVANLFAELHDLLMPQYRAALQPGGTLLMTGIMAGVGQADAGERVTWDTSSGRENLVMTALHRDRMEFVRREQAGDWVLIEARKPLESETV